MSRTSTVTNAFQALGLRGRDPTPPSSEAGRHYPEPLTLSGALSADKYSRVQLTPALGIEFGKELKLKEILGKEQAERDALIRDIAILISQNGVAFFQDQSDITPQDLATLGTLLGELSGKPESSTLHIHPTQELGENGLPVGKITNVADAEGRQISFMDMDAEHSLLTAGGWHSDVSFEPVPSAYTLLRMHTLPTTGGDTLWQSSYSAYDNLSPPLQAFLETLTATHDAERFREQSRRHGFKLRTAPRGSPKNAGDAFRASHPVIRTNPVTGLKGLYVNPTFTKRINELNFDESAVLLAYLFRLQAECHDTHVKYHWTAGNLAVWDNRAVNHLATFDYTEPRAGDRVVVCGEEPYLDPASRSRRQARAEEIEKNGGGKLEGVSGKV